MVRGSAIEESKADSLSLTKVKRSEEEIKAIIQKNPEEPAVLVFSVIQNNRVVSNTILISESQWRDNPSEFHVWIAGRHPTCHIFLENPETSNFQLQIILQGGIIELIPLSCVHRTRISGHTVPVGVRVDLADEHTIRLGDDWSIYYRLVWTPLRGAYDVATVETLFAMPAAVFALAEELENHLDERMILLQEELLYELEDRTLTLRKIKLKINISRILGACEGVVLVEDQKSSYLVYPFLGKAKMLPAAPVQKSKVLNRSLGIGLARGDYKVILMMSNLDAVQIFTLSCDSWQLIGSYPHSCILKSPLAISHKHSLYWLAENGKKQVIFCFDLIESRCSEFSIPHLKYGNLELVQLAGNLCLSVVGHDFLDLYLVFEAAQEIILWKEFAINVVGDSITPVRLLDDELWVLGRNRLFRLDGSEVIDILNTSSIVQAITTCLIPTKLPEL